MTASSPLDGEIRNGRHWQPVRIYYEDTDFSGVVYHASYLRFMERGRTNYLRLLGVSHRSLFEKAVDQAQAGAFAVRSMQIEFHKAARMDDLLNVVTTPYEVKGASAVLDQRIERGDEILVEAKVRFAFVSDGRPRPLPEALRLAMQADQRLAMQSERTSAQTP